MYEHTCMRAHSYPDGPFMLLHLALMLAVFAVCLVLLLLFLLGFFGYNNFIGDKYWIFAKNADKEVPKEKIKTEDISENPENLSEKCQFLKKTETPISNSTNQEPIENISEELEKSEDFPDNQEDTDSFLKSEGSSFKPEGSPKSTSSCISSELPEEPEEISRPSSFASSISSSNIPIFEFTRKTPEFIPRMMAEEFESLDRSIEKRKLDIRDLLRRIESAKRRHRKFTEHLQRVQHDHQLD